MFGVGQKTQGICWFDLGSVFLHCELREIVESMNAPNGRQESLWTAAREWFTSGKHPPHLPNGVWDV